MDHRRSAGAQLQRQPFFFFFARATLLGLVAVVVLLLLLSVAPPCSCSFQLRTFLLVSVPSAASAVATPRCLFVFSNIIVVFLATESKLSRLRTRKNIEAFYHGAASDLAPAMRDTKLVNEEEDDENGVVVSAQEAPHQHEDSASSSSSSPSAIFWIEELTREPVEELGSSEDDQEEAIEREDCEEEEEEEVMDLPTDELNKKVEDFIARFNMERQLEAEMLFCCY